MVEQQSIFFAKYARLSVDIDLIYCFLEELPSIHKFLNALERVNTVT